MKFKVGDTVKIKSWDAMVKEFNGEGKLDLELPDGFLFNRAMKPFCGSVFTITKVDLGSDDDPAPTFKGCKRLDWASWNLSEDMIELGRI